MTRSLLLAGLLLGCLPMKAGAQLDPELDKPYRLQIVLRVAENRFLTPTFQEQLQGALRDQVQLALGALAKVEVVRSHPLLANIEAKGLETGLDGLEWISGVKLHFVLVDFVDGSYLLKSRQYDGMTGLQSPLPRLARTNDRTLVAREGARLVLQDFGVVGTVVQTGKDYRLALRGGKLGVPLERWAKTGEVFAISRITKEGDKTRGTRVPWALLEVLDLPRDGICRCRLWHRFQEDDLREQPGVLGYRCLKLTTTPGPLKLRLIDDEQFQPLPFLQVHIRKPGTPKADELTTNRAGLVVTRENFRHFAVVRVMTGDTVRAQFPVAMTGAGTVECRLKINADAEQQMSLEFRKDLWLRRILDNLRLAAERVVQLNQELTESLGKALGTAQAGLKNMDGEISYLVQERAQIRRYADEKSVKLDLRDGEVGLESLTKKKEELASFVARIDSAVKDSASEKTLGLAKILERARLLEGEADFDQAIGLYDKFLAASPDQPKVKEHLDRLKTAWATKNSQHKEARAFLVGIWPKVEVAELAKNLDMAHAALAICKEAQDRLTPLKVMQADILHAANLKKLLDTLKRQDNADNRAQLKALVPVAESLRRLHAEAAALAGTSKKE